MVHQLIREQVRRAGPTIRLDVHALLQRPDHEAALISAGERGVRAQCPARLERLGRCTAANDTPAARAADGSLALTQTHRSHSPLACALRPCVTFSVTIAAGNPDETQPPPPPAHDRRRALRTVADAMGAGRARLSGIQAGEFGAERVAGCSQPGER